MDASAVSLVVAGLAVVVGIAVAVVLLRRRPRARARARHPSATPPVAISLERRGREAFWRVDVRAGLPTTAIDIVSYRPSGVDATWESEPIIDPIEIQPGGWALLPSAVLGRAPAYEVVMAWTVRHPDGDVPGSGSFLVTEQEGAVSPEPPAESPRDWVAAAVALLLLLAAAGAFVAAELVDALEDRTVGTAPATSAPPPTTVTRATATTTRPATTMRPQSATSTTTNTTNTTTSITTSTTSSTSTSSSTSSSTVPDGPRVIVEGRVEDCRFGADCLIVGFVIEDFDTPPNEYVCEFGDGSRTAFRFGGTAVDTACRQSGADPAITVEVAGVRSETLTRDDVT